jgi:hypothetical protein
MMHGMRGIVFFNLFTVSFNAIYTHLFGKHFHDIESVFVIYEYANRCFKFLYRVFVEVTDC